MAAQGVWVSIDGAEKVQSIVTTELLASRHALDNSLAVLFWPFGFSLEEAIAADKDRRAKLAGKPAAAVKKPKAGD